MKKTSFALLAFLILVLSISFESCTVHTHAVVKPQRKPKVLVVKKHKSPKHPKAVVVVRH